MTTNTLTTRLSQDWLRSLIVLFGFGACWVIGGWIGGFNGGLGLFQLLVAGAGFALVLALFEPHWTAYLAILVLPFYNISPVLSYQTFLVVGALGVVWGRSAASGEPFLAGDRLSRTDALVVAYLVANVVALVHGFFVVNFDPDLSRALSRSFSDSATGILAYVLCRYWAVRGYMSPRLVTGLITVSVLVLAALLLAYLGDNGFDLSFFTSTTISGGNLRGRLYELDPSAGLLARGAVEPGGPNLKTLAFLVGMAMVLPHLVGRASGRSRIWTFAIAQIFVLCIALLFSRSGLFALVLMGFVSITMGSERRPVAVLVGALAVLMVLMVNSVGGFWQATTLAYLNSQGLDLGSRALYSSELLGHMFTTGKVFFGMGFDVAAHTFQVSEFQLSSFNTHNDLLWVLSNGGLVTLGLFLTLVYRLARLAVRLRASGDSAKALFGNQVLLYLLGVSTVSMFHLHGIYPQYATWAWILLALAETEGRWLGHSAPWAKRQT